MSNKAFNIILYAIIIAGLITTITLVAYTIHKHNNCSIITYIGNEV